MLETLFRQQGALIRHREARFFTEREQYLQHMNQQRTSIHRIRVMAGMLLNVVKHLKVTNLNEISKSEIAEATKSWSREREGYLRPGAHCDANAFRLVATGWLNFHNALVPEPPAEFPYGELLHEYLKFLAGPRAMTAATVNGYKSRAARFLNWAITRHQTFATITLQDIEDYVATLNSGRMKTRSVASVCFTLRSLFTFAKAHRWTDAAFSRGIAIPRTPRYDNEPKGPRWSEVRRMLSAPTGDKLVNIRGKAVLFLLSVYGLRSIEVSSLELTDFDWEENTMALRRAKGGRTQRFPLTAEVRDALSRYLKDARPECECRNFFVTLRPPYRAMIHSSLRQIVACSMRDLRIKSKLFSTHALRHSCATQLLHKGMALNEIARFLGHQNNKTVGAYAKCSKASVREVANFSLRGIL